jgi:hypothetical protein
MEKRINLLPLPEIETQFLSHTAHNLVPVPTEVSCLLLYSLYLNKSEHSLFLVNEVQDESLGCLLE